MKVLLYGHSYVRDLNQKCQWENHILVNNKLVNVEYHFRYFPGKDFEFLLNKEDEFGIVAAIKPDIIVIVLGGNSIVAAKSNEEIRALISSFYTKLRQSLPESIIIATQIEPRFCAPGNRHGAPEAEEFNRRRTVLNNFMNKTIKKAGLLNHMVLLGSSEFLNHHQYFTDGVHLKGIGLQRYQAAILGTIRYSLERQ